MDLSYLPWSEVPIGNGNFDHHVGEDILEMVPIEGDDRWACKGVTVCINKLREQ